MSDFEKAQALLREFKGDTYLYGAGILSQVGKVIASQGKRPALVRDTFPGSGTFVQTIRDSAAVAGAWILPRGPAINSAMVSCY